MDYQHDYFKGKTVLVTGAAGGIGLALIEELLLSNAAKAVLVDINEDKLNGQVVRLQKQYGEERVKGILCDISKEENVRSMIAEAASFFDNSFDLLINNAGAMFPGNFSEMSVADWKAAFDLNFYSAVHSMQTVLPIMLKQGGGQIINIISGIAFSPMPRQSRYSATKAALNALSMALRAEYWDDNIKISAATPGTTLTAIWGKLAPPKNAQTAQQSASRILNGVVNNDRVIFGDDQDAHGASNCYDYNAQAGKDAYFLHIARMP